MSPVTQNEITLFNDAFNKSPRGDCQQLQIASRSGMVAGDFDVSESFRKGYSSMKKSVGLGIVLCFAIVLAGCAKEGDSDFEEFLAAFGDQRSRAGPKGHIRCNGPRGA